MAALGADQAADAGGRRGAAGRPRGGCLHVICFEEAGECTLERIAREAVPGDCVLALGPESWATELHGFGLSPEVEVVSVGRARGRYAVGRAEPWSAVRAYGPRAAEVSGAPIAQVPEELPVPPQWSPERRMRVRAELGMTRDECAVLVAGEPSEWLDLSFAMGAIAMARVAGRRLRPVVSPRVPRITLAARWLEGAAPAIGIRGTRDPIAVDTRADRPWQLLPAMDALVLDRDGMASLPIACAGWRAPRACAGLDRMSSLPALWALACGVPVFAHASIDLGRHATHPEVVRFGADVAQLARELHARVAHDSDHTRASSASAASR